uniref:Uncharacterized protein n=1 Tax=Homalodisca liturata TaxID=320908 RepID=A0A1B6I8K4_9HEMI
MHASNHIYDTRRPDRQHRFKRPTPNLSPTPEDLTIDYMNLLGILLSITGLMLKLKWCSWLALYCSCFSFANSNVYQDNKHTVINFMLSLSAVVMTYLQSPHPVSFPWATELQ